MFWSIFPPKQEAQKIVAFAAVSRNYNCSHTYPSSPVQVLGCSMSRGSFLRAVFPLLPDSQKPIQMSKIPEDPTSPFLEYYGQYFTAKRQKEPHMIWLSAVACRRELQKMGEILPKDFRAIRRQETSRANTS
jgi:hypothetical protein